MLLVMYSGLPLCPELQRTSGVQPLQLPGEHIIVVPLPECLRNVEGLMFCWANPGKPNSRVGEGLWPWRHCWWAQITLQSGGCVNESGAPLAAFGEEPGRSADSCGAFGYALQLERKSGRPTGLRPRTHCWWAQDTPLLAGRVNLLAPLVAFDEQPGRSDALVGAFRYAPRPELKLGEGTWSAALEALLVGHEDWVHGLAWQPPPSQKASHTSRPDPKPTLLSASMDRTMMLWRPDIATGMKDNVQCTVGSH